MSSLRPRTSFIVARRTAPSWLSTSPLLLSSLLLGSRALAAEPGAPAPAVEPRATKPPADEAPSAAAPSADPPKPSWDLEFSGYFRAPMMIGLSERPNPDGTGEQKLQLSHAPNRVVDANYNSFSYTRLQEGDWAELYVTAKRPHVAATLAFMGYWYTWAGYENPKAAWLPAQAWVDLDSDVALGALRPHVNLKAGAFWQRWGMFEKYDTYLFGRFHQVGGALEVQLPLGSAEARLVEGFGTNRNGLPDVATGLTLLQYTHLGLKLGKWLDAGLYYNQSWTRDPALFAPPTTAPVSPPPTPGPSGEHSELEAPRGGSMQRAQQGATALVTSITLSSAAWLSTAWAQRQTGPSASAEHGSGSESASDSAPPALASVPLPPPPDVLFGELFEAVQLAELFADQKVFPDAVPLFDPDQILADYAKERDQPGFDLRAFVDAHFALPDESGITPPANQSLREHIEWLWPELTRTTTSAPPSSSLIPLPEPYVVPGGRFREVYYWDSYFTMLGLAESGLDDVVLDMVENFADEIDRFGHIPNGNRTYYLSRSQPPFFSQMVELAARLAGTQIYATYLPQLQREHAYWMAGLADTTPGGAAQHVVVLPDGTVLNRYWDALDTPRPEAYAADVRTAASAEGRPANDVYRDLRATAESGIDFSSRWLADGRTLATIRTTSIIPVDLNSLLVHLETTIARGCRQLHDRSCVRSFTQEAHGRAAAIQRYLYSEADGYYVDYDFVRGEARSDLTAAALYPLFVGVASADRASSTADHVRTGLLEAGGLSTTTVNTGEQWDNPNGWAPLNWVAIAGLERYGEDELARDIGTRFLASVEAVYAAEGKLVEKYDVVAGANGGGGGEYPLQDGFGWTNAVTLKLLERYAASQTEPEEDVMCHE